MVKYHPSRQAFNRQKHTAKDRGIEFNFSHDEWIKWWEDNLGEDWMKMRGCRRGQYVMSRKEDKGAYISWNVACILCEHNHVIRNVARWRKWSR